jgi:hypothetical protein
LPLLQFEQALSTEVDSDDNELAALTDLGDDFAGRAFVRSTLDDVLGFSGRTVALALDDLTRKDDVLEIEDGEVVIFAIDTWAMQECTSAVLRAPVSPLRRAPRPS